MPQTPRLLANNQTYASRYEEPDRTARPHLGVAVVACMDARLDLFGALGLADGDAHLIRN
ncbi:MAG TPA: carbonic anhydrase, partial [Candidatus Dormibacteraeota bacterium]|nr:carbonic anhydrase [Candidatus Dormibacteraeota bacterium]